MNEPGNGTRFRLDDLTRRVTSIEADLREREKMWRERFHNNEADAAALRLLLTQLTIDMEHVGKRVTGMSRAWWALTGGIILACVTFTLAVASGQIG